MSEDLLNSLEEHAFYESGLSSHGCLEKLDEFSREAIKRYGRILSKDIQEAFDMQTKLVINLELEKIQLQKKNEIRNI